jgi:hypothetical protein
MVEGDFYGMQSFDQALVALFGQDLVTIEAAAEAASNPHASCWPFARPSSSPTADPRRYPRPSPSANRAARSNGCSRYPVKIQTSR